VVIGVPRPIKPFTGVEKMRTKLLVMILGLIILSTLACTGEATEPTGTPSFTPTPEPVSFSTPIPATISGSESRVTVTPSIDEEGLLPITSDFFAIRNNWEEVPYLNDGDPDHIMTVVSPEGDGPFPALIVVPGSGGRAETPFGAFYAQRGFVGFSIDYQLSSSETPAWPMAVQDVICAVRHIKQNAERYRIDPDRIGVMGAAFGGYFALMIGTLQGDEAFLEGACDDLSQDSRVDIVVVYSSFPDLVGYAENKSVTDRFEQFLGASYADDPALWRLASPISHVDPDDGAVFVIGHGSRDQESPIGPVKQFVRIMEEAGVETHFLEIEDASHTFWAAFSRPEDLEEMRHFLEPIMERRLQP